MKKGSNIRHVSITINPDDKTVKVTFSPHKTQMDKDTVVNRLNDLIAGFGLGINIVLSNSTMLRAPTKIETDEHLYVFADPMKDNPLYKARTTLYNEISNALSGILSEMFSDVLWIDKTRAYQQEMVTAMTKEEADKYKEHVQEIVDKVKAQVTQDGNPKMQ